MSEPFTFKVINWNKLRRPPVFNYELCCKMLLEEVDELYASTDVVSSMDAIGDIIFVAVGELWKLGLNGDDITDVFYRIDIRNLKGSALSYDYMLKIKTEYIEFVERNNRGDPTSFIGFELALNSVFHIAIPVAYYIGVLPAIYDICHAICDSNNTKEIVRVGNNVKSSKGPNFIPPTSKLESLFELVKQLDERALK